MKLVEVTFTLTKKIRVEVPSCLSDLEIGLLAQQHLAFAPEIFAVQTTEAISFVKASSQHQNEQGLYGVAVNQGKLNFGFVDDDNAVESDEDFYKLTGRAPPPSPSQKSFFDPEKT